VGAAHPGIAPLAGVSVEDRRFGPQTADTTGSISAAIAPIVTPRVLYVGSDDGVRLHGSGAHWTRFGTGLPNVRVTDLKLNATMNILAAPTQGRGSARSARNRGTWSIQEAAGYSMSRSSVRMKTMFGRGDVWGAAAGGDPASPPATRARMRIN